MTEKKASEEEAADVVLAREAEAVLAEGGPTVTMAELLADLSTDQVGDRRDVYRNP